MTDVPGNPRWSFTGRYMDHNGQSARRRRDGSRWTEPAWALSRQQAESKYSRGRFSKDGPAEYWSSDPTQGHRPNRQADTRHPLVASGPTAGPAELRRTQPPRPT
jgi:hypothetical protein